MPFNQRIRQNDCPVIFRQKKGHFNISTLFSDIDIEKRTTEQESFKWTHRLIGPTDSRHLALQISVNQRFVKDWKSRV
jgi:hypothetical protein